MFQKRIIYSLYPQKKCRSTGRWYKIPDGNFLNLFTSIMKLTKLIILAIAVIGMFACKKESDVHTPDLNVDGYTVKEVMDSTGTSVKEVTFQLSGAANVVSFYSGLIGNDYAFRDGRILGVDACLASFSTTVDNGTQDNQLSVMVSTDYDGIADIAHIRAAQWTDITSRFALNVRGATASLPSGVKDIRDLHVPGKPIYIGFRYICKPQTQFGANSTWRIRAFAMQSQTVLGISSLATLTTADWKLVNDGAIIDPNRGAVIESSGNIRLNGNHLNKEVQTESWAISKGFLIGDTDMGPDRAIGIKSAIDPQPATFSYGYTVPGTYKVAFVAANVNYNGEQSIVRELEVVIP
jgi:hypothetical protein